LFQFRIFFKFNQR